MFCPKCSQQQASDQMRFCSRCGFPLSTVADLLTHDGVLTEAGEVRLSPRQKGVRQGTVLLFASLVMGFFTALLSVFVIGRPELFVSITAGVFFLSGILRIAYAYIFERGVPDEASASREARLGASAHHYALPRVPSNLVPSLGTQRVNTAEMVSRPSVTEHTTKLLDRE